MLPRGFNVAFHAGLALSVMLLMSGRREALPMLFWIGAAHVVVLYGIGRRVPIPGDGLVVSTLHKTGFLHTLIGLSAAVVTVARSWAGAAAGAETTASLLLPLGTALVPHVMGIWLAHGIEVRNAGTPTPVEDVRKRVDDLATATFRVLGRLQAALGELETTVTAVARECSSVTAKTGDALAMLAASTTSIASGAHELHQAVGKTVATNRQIAILQQQFITLLRALLPADRAGEVR